jgi:hypothetical protein
MTAKGPVPIPIYPDINNKYRDRIIATYGKSERQGAKELVKEIEQEFFDTAHAQGLPGQAATPMNGRPSA